MAGATLMPGRCVPHGPVGTTASGVGGQGSSARLNVVSQLVGAPATSVEYATLVATSADTFTSHEPGMSCDLSMPYGSAGSSFRTL